MARPSRTVVLFMAVAVFAVGLTGCSPRETSDPRLRERVFAMDAHSLGPLLELTATLEGTPLASLSKEWLVDSVDCPLIFVHRSARDEAPATDDRPFDCIGPADPQHDLAQLALAHRGDADGILFWPLGDDGRIELRIDVATDGSITVEGRAIAPSDPGLLSLLLPGNESLAAPIITPAATLFHARLTPEDGLGLTRFMPSGGQADRMFALKGRLLEGALLRGSVELGFLPPANGGEIPLALGALHHRGAAPIEEALDQALDQLEATWPIRRSAHAFATPTGVPQEGGCFNDLPLLPELAPCWLVTPEALLIGYRAEAIEAGLSRPAVSDAPISSPVDTNAAARFDLYLDRIARADALADGFGQAPALGALFSTLSASWSRTPDGDIAITARLERAIR